MANTYLFPYEIQEVTPQSGIPWNVQQVNAPSFWQRTKGDGAVVAIIDTGLDVNHSEFAGRVISYQNFTSDASLDSDGHGTHVAGIIAGKTVGVAPECRLMALKALGNGMGAFSIEDAFKYILDYNEKVPEQDRVVAVNCSWGGPYNPIHHYLIRRLIHSGVAVIVAAGNAGDGKPETEEIFSWPGFLYEVITTGATNKDGQPAGYSSSYDGIDIGAPGTEIYSAWPGGGYKLLSGTSMATPHVTAAYALIAAAFKQREGRYPTVDEGEDILFKHIRQIGADPRFIGKGLLDLTFDLKRWPLYRVQTGAYYYKQGAEITSQKLKDAGFNTYIVKY